MKKTPGSKKNLIWILFALALIVCAWIGATLVPPREWARIGLWLSQELHSLVAAQPFLFALAFAACTGLLFVVGFPVVSPLALVGGLLFGPIPGGLLVSFAATWGGLVFALLSRRSIGREMDKRIPVTMERMQRVRQRFGNAGILALRVGPLIPHTIFNLVLGSLGVKPFAFLWTTFLGILPTCLVYSWLGSEALQAWLATHKLPWQAYALFGFLGATAIITICAKFFRTRASTEAKRIPRPARLVRGKTETA